MSSLPVISHHLFVEAASHEEREASKEAEKQSVLLNGIATALPLELLDAAEPLPEGVTRSLRTGIFPSGS